LTRFRESSYYRDAGEEFGLSTFAEILNLAGIPVAHVAQQKTRVKSEGGLQ